MALGAEQIVPSRVAFGVLTRQVSGTNFDLRVRPAAISAKFGRTLASGSSLGPPMTD